MSTVTKTLHAARTGATTAAILWCCANKPIPLPTAATIMQAAASSLSPYLTPLAAAASPPDTTSLLKHMKPGVESQLQLLQVAPAGPHADFDPQGHRQLRHALHALPHQPGRLGWGGNGEAGWVRVGVGGGGQGGRLGLSLVRLAERSRRGKFYGKTLQGCWSHVSSACPAMSNTINGGQPCQVPHLLHCTLLHLEEELIMDLQPAADTGVPKMATRCCYVRASVHMQLNATWKTTICFTQLATRASCPRHQIPGSAAGAKARQWRTCSSSRQAPGGSSVHSLRCTASMADLARSAAEPCECAHACMPMS